MGIDEDVRSTPYDSIYGGEISGKPILATKGLTWKTVQNLLKLINTEVFNNYIYEAVRAGNIEVAHELILPLIKHQNWGFNALHADVLKTKGDLNEFHRANVQKKCHTNCNITPLHCSAANPDPKVMKALIDAGADIHMMDNELRKPIHYAAGCAGPEPLKLLLQLGASPFDMDN